MKVEKDMYLRNVRCDCIDLIVIPTVRIYTKYYIPDPNLKIEYQEFPDSFFINLKDDRVSLGKENSIIFLSQIGFLCLIDEIYKRVEEKIKEKVNYFESVKDKIELQYISCETKKIEKLKQLTKEKYIDLMLKKYEKVESKTVNYVDKNKYRLLRTYKN